MTTDNRTFFELPTIENDQSLRAHPFGTWLLDQDERHNDWFVAFDEWAKSLGFDMNKHFCSEEVINQCKTVHDCVWRIWFKVKNVIDLDEWLTPCLACDHEAYCIRDWDKSTYCQLSNDMIKFLGDNFNNSLIYELKPENYSFKIINEGLFICYQQIIGSRLIAGIKK